MTDHRDLTGWVVGGHRILRKLGQGGMATVYKAYEESLHRVVALKVIGQHLSGHPEFVERFRREAQTAAQLSHPNIVQIHTIGEDEGIHFFSMEYVKGESLKRLIERQGFLTAERAVPIVAQVAHALVAAHAAMIVHRDIKPANIILDQAGRVHVADFGIAQMLTETRMTQSGAMVGTPGYVSPEQCRGDTLDARSDIYALGVTLFEMLSGRAPFDADSVGALVLQVVEGRKPKLGELNPTIPPSLQGVVEQMMHLDRERRFQTAEELLDTLDTLEVRSVAHKARAPATTVPARGQAIPDARAPSLTHDSTPIATGQAGHLGGGGLSGQTDAGRQSSVDRGLPLAWVVPIVLVLSTVFAWRLIPVERPEPVPALARESDSGAGHVTPAARTRPPTNTTSTDPPPRPTPAPGVEVPPHPEVGPLAALPHVEAPVRPAVSEPVPSPDPAQEVQADNGITAPLPASNSVVVSTAGDVEYVDLVQTWIEAVLVDQNFMVMDSRSATSGPIEQTARFDVAVTTEVIGSRQLEFFGQSETQYTAVITLRANDLANGSTVVGPASTTVQHTSINLQQNLRAATRTLAYQTARRLNEIVR